MKTSTHIKAKQMNILFGILALIAVVTIAPHVFAQLSYTVANDPHGPLESFAWAIGMGTAGALSGFGAWTVIKRSH